MKLEALLGTLLLGSLIACSGAKEEAPAEEKQPAAAKTTAEDEDETSPESDTTANNTTTPAPVADPAATTPAEPVPAGPETCETLAAKAATPAGKLSEVTVSGVTDDITPVDVYATEGEEGLNIILTETANACGYHANNLLMKAKNELTITFPKTATEFGAGTFKASGVGQKQGTVCFAGEDDFGPIGSHGGGGGAKGSVTITSKTATLVEGTVSITAFDGSKTSFAFSAPICAQLEPTEETTCCAPLQ